VEEAPSKKKPVLHSVQPVEVQVLQSEVQAVHTTGALL